MSLVNGVPVAMPPPPGYVVDFDNPQRQSVGATYAVIGAGNFLALVFLAQRLFVKLKVRHNFGIDDVCVLFAWVCSVAIQGLIASGYADGYIGVHLWELPLPKFVLFLKKGLYVYPILYSFPPTLTKIALLIFYLSLGGRQQRVYTMVVYFTVFVVLGSFLGILFGNAFACTPVSKFWDLTMTTGSCINRLALYKATAIFGIITDVMVFVIPVPMIVGLQMSVQKKAGVIFIFAVGSATVVTSIVRLVLLIRSFNTLDQPWAGGPVTLWICVESNLLIICACLPTLRQAVTAIAPRILGDSLRAKSYENNSDPLSHRSAQHSKSAVLSSRRGEYLNFGHGADYGMDTFVKTGNKSGRKDRQTWSVDANRESKENGSTYLDDDSEKGIMQTTAVAVQYEPRGKDSRGYR